jgi:hypothetical protein
VLVQDELDGRHWFEEPLKLPLELETVENRKPPPVIVVLATVCEMLTTYCIELMAETMVVPVITPTPAMVPPMLGAFVKTESVSVVPEIEPVVLIEHAVLPVAGWQKSDGVDVARKDPDAHALHTRSATPAATAPYEVPAGQLVLCAVQPVVDVRTFAPVEGVVGADENQPAGQIVHVRSVVVVAGAE